MDTLSNPVATEPEPPLTEAGQAALRDDMLSSLGTMPFLPGALISRSLWLIFICPWGFRNPVVLPVDDRLDLPEPDDIASWCDLLAHFMEHPRREETALVVLQRPGPANISDADKYIYRVMREAAAGLQTAPWAFYVTGPDGVQQVTEYNAEPQPDLGSLTGPAGAQGTNHHHVLILDGEGGQRVFLPSTRESFSRRRIRLLSQLYSI
jgi:hypothetical protein